MTPDELHESLATIRWPAATLAKALQCDDSLVEAWLAGKATIPPLAAAWIRVLADAHLAVEMEKPRSLKGKRFKG